MLSCDRQQDQFPHVQDLNPRTPFFPIDFNRSPDHSSNRTPYRSWNSPHDRSSVPGHVRLNLAHLAVDPHPDSLAVSLGV